MHLKLVNKSALKGYYSTNNEGAEDQTGIGKLEEIPKKKKPGKDAIIEGKF